MFFSALRHSSHSLNRLAISLVVLVAAIGIFASSASAGIARNGIGVTSPRSGATLTDTAVIKARVGKAIARRTARVEVWVGSNRVATDWAAPYRFNVDTTQLEDGKYQFRVRAVLKKGHKGSTSRALTYSQLIAVYIANKKKTSAKKPTTVKPVPTAPTTVPPPPPAPTVDPTIAQITSGQAGWHTVFADEFNGTQLDRTKFNDQRDDWLKGGWAYSNLEDDQYMPANTTVSGGNLVQTIRKERSPDGHNYTTGMVNTNKRFSFQYGYVEARMNVPACDGCWPAFWMLPNQQGWPPEIDIFEFFDSDTDTHAYFSSHWKSTTADQEWTSVWSSPANLTNNWHTYGMRWTSEGITPYVDGVAGPTLTGKAVPHEAMYLIIQQALGHGYNTPDGVQLKTDYLRVYQQ
ncbi:MAG: family 16 glycosylhydrolase [Thermoleophilaceae bacterium]|nr:family 16 glycosylhydrolase [Thermoleophilaceae bacterium]